MAPVTWPQSSSRERSVRQSYAMDEYAAGDARARIARRPQTWPSVERRIDVSPEEPSKSKSFSDKLYRLCRLGETEAALDLLLDEVDPLLEVEDYSRCARILAELDVRRLDVTVTLGVLSSMFHDRKLIPSYGRFFDAARERIRAERGEEADQLTAPFR